MPEALDAVARGPKPGPAGPGLSAPSRSAVVDDRKDGPGASVHVEVRVELKPGILDAEGESVAKSLALLGIPSVRHVGTARVYDLEFVGIGRKDAERLAGEAVDRLLANPVVHRVSVRPIPS